MEDLEKEKCSCDCCEECTCGTDCNCTPDNKCCDNCTCDTSCNCHDEKQECCNGECECCDDKENCQNDKCTCGHENKTECESTCTCGCQHHDKGLEKDDKSCGCGENCTCGDNCECDDNNKCCDECTCGEQKDGSSINSNCDSAEDESCDGKDECKCENQDKCDEDCKCDNDCENPNCDSTEDDECQCGCGEKLNENTSDAYFKQLLSLQAEFDNYRKRTQSEISKAYQNGFNEAITQFIPALDSFKMATEYITDQNTLVGIQYIEKGILETLQKIGVEVIDTNCKFDPNFHQAIGSEVSQNHESGDIIKECFKGFKMGDKVIRYAQVIVAK